MPSSFVPDGGRGSESADSTFGSDEQGFFKVYAALFQYLAAEEAVHAGASYREYPTFGTSTTPWSLPSRQDFQVRSALLAPLTPRILKLTHAPHVR